MTKAQELAQRFEQLAFEEAAEMFGRFIYNCKALESMQSRVDWLGLRDEYFEKMGNRFFTKRNYHFTEVEDKLINYLLHLGIVSTDPMNNYLIIRSGHLWGPCASWIHHVFFTDKETAKEYVKVFEFRHGVADRGEPILLRAVGV